MFEAAPLSLKHHAYSTLGSIQRNVQCELEGLRKMLQLQEQAAASVENPPGPLFASMTPRAKDFDKQDRNLTAQSSPFRSRRLFQEPAPLDPAAARCEAMLQQAELSADVLHESLELETKELAHVREAMEVKWRDIARKQGDEIRDLKKVVAEKDKALDQLRQELRQALQLAVVHEEDLVTRSNATLRRNEELQKLATAAHETNQVLMAQVHTLRRALEDQRAAALDQRGKDDQWRAMLDEKNRHLQDRLNQETQAKADLQATLVSVLQIHTPPPPSTVRATTVCVPKPHKPPPSVAHPSPHALAPPHGLAGGAAPNTTSTVPPSTKTCVPLWK